MSSVDFSKCKGAGQAAARVAHMERHDGKDVEYANRWIDKSRTHLNTVIGASGLVDDVPSTRKTMARLKKRVREIDDVLPPKRVRKDRVTMVTLTIAAPDGLLKKDEERFFRIAYDEIATFCGGAENCSDGFIHRDEQHEYIDTDGSRQTSRPHMHMAVIPFVEGVGVNGKQFETRSRMKELNEAIDRRCRKELHVQFMTHRRGRTGRTVEDLQAMSEGKAIEKVQQQLTELKDALDVQKEAYDARAEYLDRVRGFNPIADVKEHKTLTGKVKSYEIAADDWERVIKYLMEAEAVKKLRERLNGTLKVMDTIRDVYAANEELDKAYKRLLIKSNSDLERIKDKYTALENDMERYTKAVEMVAENYPGFAQELAQELRPAVEKLVEQYNRQQTGRQRDNGWER